MICQRANHRTDTRHPSRVFSRAGLQLMSWLALWMFALLLVACQGSDSTQAPTAVVVSSGGEPTFEPTVSPSAPPAPSFTSTAVIEDSTATPSFTVEPPSTPTAQIVHTLSVETPTSIGETATSTPTSTATSTPTPVPTETTSVQTPAPEAAPVQTTTPSNPPASGALVQPPYSASPCSDRYPCNDDVAGWEGRIRVQTGYVDRYFGRVAGNPTSIAFGPDGRLYIALLQGTIVVMDSGGQVANYAGGLNTPTGIAFRPGSSDLYVSSRVRNENYGGEAQVSVIRGGSPLQIIGGLPCCYAGMHGANGIAFGADGFGYIGVGGRSDHGEIPDGSNQQDVLQPFEASILRFSADGSLVEPYARGFRNPYDIAWDASGVLYATDNAPDYGPPEELNRVVPGGQHGYPWFGCEICFKPPDDVQQVPPVFTFIPHAAPTGITVYLANQFPGSYNHIFVTLWSAFPGAQKVVRLSPGGTSATDFALGFAQPIDVTVGPDGNLYVADYATGIIFQISYSG